LYHPVILPGDFLYPALSPAIKNFYASVQILISASEEFLLKYSQIQFSEYIF